MLSCIHFHICFSSSESRRFSRPRRSRNTSRSTAMIVPLAPHQDGTKQGRRCSQSTWSLDTHWAGALSGGYSQQYMLHQASLWYSGHITESTKLGSLDRFGRELARNFGFYKFHSCSLCHKVLQSGLSAKIPSLPFALEIVFLQSLPNIHDHILVSERCDTSRLLKI